ncbi:MAG: 16S rRNA (cytosine(1402)-N(4))-methyltransferase RsmH, partial [Myxococcota bacterium]
MTQWDDDRLPYASAYHTPIMVGAVLEHLCPAPSSTLLDATLGGAGHTLAMLERGAHVLAIDRDPDALDHARARLAEHIERVTLIEGNYGDVVDLLARHRAPKVDGVLLDAGVSSHQIDEASRGFSSRFDAPLDMRMSSSGDSAADLLERSSAQELGRLLADYGELKGAFRIARGLKAARENGNLDTTAQLRDLVLAHAPKGPRKGVSPVTLVFQALRIAVNEELAHLERFVASIPRFVRPGGTVAIISFHSLEDR